ncbi:MAG: hypothetical protein CMA30_06515 [Euryarchaeota archaeon]|nr:hypothetical protein [Euryarchaeota archaeon]
MIITSIIVLLVSFLPGYALCKVLDASADKWRKAMLSPALGLLLLYGISGLVVISGVWSFASMTAIILLLNTLALAHIKRRIRVDKKLTPWQKLEAVMHGQILESEDLYITEEAAAQQWFQSRRSPILFLLGSVTIIGVFLLPFIQSLPFGVDWIGFSTLTSQLSVTGNFSLSGTNDGFWTYPPAFPALAAWLQNATGIGAGRAVFELGHYSLIVILLGLAGALDHHGSGAHGILALSLGFGLFAKAYDSGYPTVSSQLGLVVGLLVLLRPSSARGSHHTRGFIIAVICVTLIHPTGAIYLGMLMISHIFIGISLNKEYSENMQRLLLTCSILLTIAGAISILLLAPRMLDSAVFAEYGWQGGKPLITFNLFLLILGAIAGWKLRSTVEGRLLITWFAGLWLLTSIHLIEGLESIPVLSLLSYTLYSMGIHAFHVPLAALVAIWWSPTTGLTSLEEKRGLMTVGWDPTISDKMSKILTGLILVGVLIANSVVWHIASHDELRPITQGDLEIREKLSNLPDGSIVYSENSHWGHVFDAPENVELTSIPTLGLVQIDSSIHSSATTAIFLDNTTKIKELGINYAITSPIGTMGWTFAMSPYWQEIENIRGSKLWQFNSNGLASTSQFSVVNQTSCQDNCEMRIDPWNEHRFSNLDNLTEERAFIEEGKDAYLEFIHTGKMIENATICMVYEMVGEVDGLEIIHSTNISVDFESISGWNQKCWIMDYQHDNLQLEFNWEGTSSDSWLNPTGLSGRGDRIIDTSGIRIHWLEIR